MTSPLADRYSDRTRQIERRNSISSIFVGILFGLAFTEAVDAVRVAEQWLAGSGILFLAFFVTTLRFLIGAHLHLLSGELVELPGKIWFYDLCVIILEAVVFIFMGSLCSIDASRSSALGFVGLLAVLYVIDVVWIASQWLLAQFSYSWRRPMIPWGWAVLSTCLLAGLGLIALLPGDMYRMGALIGLGSLSVIAFVVDVILVDHAKLL